MILERLVSMHFLAVCIYRFPTNSQKKFFHLHVLWKKVDFERRIDLFAHFGI